MYYDYKPLTEEWITELHRTTADPHTGLVCTPAFYTGWLDSEEWKKQIADKTSARFEVDQMFACFVLLANNIELEV